MPVLQHQTQLKPTGRRTDKLPTQTSQNITLCFEPSALVNVTGLSTQGTQFSTSNRHSTETVKATGALNHVSVHCLVPSDYVRRDNSTDSFPNGKLNQTMNSLYHLPIAPRSEHKRSCPSENNPRERHHFPSSAIYSLY